jgi:hypothetical protein
MEESEGARLPKTKRSRNETSVEVWAHYEQVAPDNFTEYICKICKSLNKKTVSQIKQTQKN